MLKKTGRHFLELFLWLLFCVGFIGFFLDTLNAILGFPFKGVWTHQIFLTKFFIFSVASLIPFSLLLTIYQKGD